MLFLIPLVTLVAALYPCNGKLLSLPKETLDRINIQTSKDILIYILDKTEKTVKEQKKLSTVCETKINKTIAACEKCSKNLCQPKPPPVHQQIFLGLVSTVNRPLTQAARFVTDIGSNLNFIGSFGKDVLGKLAGVTNTLQKAFSKGGAQFFTDAIIGLESVGKNIGKTTTHILKNMQNWFKNIGGKFGGVFGNIGGTFGNIGGTFGNLGGQVEKFGNGVVNTGENIGKGVVDTGKNIGKAIGGLFGKRSTRHIVHKRCAKRCPQCDMLDTRKKSQDKIVDSICGSNFVSKQQKAMDNLKSMEDIYKFIEAKNLIVSKVEYDNTSIDFSGGRISFKIAHVTFQTGKMTKRYRFPGKFEISNINGMGVKISKQVRNKIF